MTLAGGIALAGGKDLAGGKALTVLNLDTTPTDELLKQIRASDDILSAQAIEV